VLPFGFGEDVVFVANDWHSALVPVLLKDVYQAKGQFKKAKVALCVHNIAFQVRRGFMHRGCVQCSSTMMSCCA
jgi:granule-bound starch synthase